MTEPCIIDIKIGKRTWDPLASETKMMEEKVCQFNKIKIEAGHNKDLISKNVNFILAKIQSLQTKSWILVSLWFQSRFILVENNKKKIEFLPFDCSIPGFQVYDVTTGRVKRYGKDYGKKLTESTVKDGTRR